MKISFKEIFPAFRGGEHHGSVVGEKPMTDVRCREDNAPGLHDREGQAGAVESK
jgi:hypothetical protein